MGAWWALGVRRLGALGVRSCLLPPPAGGERQKAQDLADPKPSSPLRGSGRGQHCLARRRWQRDRQEVRLRIEVVLARLVDDAQQLVAVGGRVRQHRVKLAPFKRRLVACVVDADDELGGRCSHERNRRKRLILNSRLPMPEASYQWISARCKVWSSRRTFATFPFACATFRGRKPSEDGRARECRCRRQTSRRW